MTPTTRWGNERIRSFPSRHTRCNVCIASEENVYVSFCSREGSNETRIARRHWRAEEDGTDSDNPARRDPACCPLYMRCTRDAYVATCGSHQERTCT
jgi:hypothetical protein